MKTTKKRYVDSFSIPPGQGGAKPYVEMEIDGEVYTVAAADFSAAVDDYIREREDIGEGMQDFSDKNDIHSKIGEVDDNLETCRIYLEDAQEVIKSLVELLKINE